MTTLTTPLSIKVIGANGQISLGKQFAGRQVLVEEQEPGVWLVRTATVIPTTNAGCTSLKLLPIWRAHWIGPRPIHPVTPTWMP